MIGIDTNVAYRWLVKDPTSVTQSDMAADIIETGREEIYIGPVVLAEVVWLLSFREKMPRARLVDVLRTVLAHPLVKFGDRDAVVQAVDAFELGGAGFVDHFIGAMNTLAGCKTTLTFDKLAGNAPHFTHIG